MSSILPNTKVPGLNVDLINDGRWSLSDQSPESFTMVVFYRGYHCPKCQEQLEDLQPKLNEFQQLGVQCIALSMDNEERAQKTHEEWGIKDLPLGYGLDEETARAWGLYISEKMKKDKDKLQEPETFNEPGLFLVRPDGTLYSASIQSMPFARGKFDDIARAIQFINKNDYPARGGVK